MWDREVCAIQSPGTHEAQGVEEDSGQPDEAESEPDPARSETALLHAGHAPLHEDRQRAEGVRQPSVHGHPAGTTSCLP